MAKDFAAIELFPLSLMVFNVLCPVLTSARQVSFKKSFLEVNPLELR